MTNTGLLKCAECQDDKLYTPVGLRAHLTIRHKRNICRICGCDKDAHKEDSDATPTAE